jgi:hypothetical protein
MRCDAMKRDEMRWDETGRDGISGHRDRFSCTHRACKLFAVGVGVSGREPLVADEDDLMLGGKAQRVVKGVEHHELPLAACRLPYEEAHSEGSITGVT